MFEKILILSSWIIVLVHSAYGLLGTINLYLSLDWIRNLYKKDGDNPNPPFFYILLPVLREQRVLKKTINYFLKMDYPEDKFKIIVLTTQKEIYERRKKSKLIKAMATDLSDGIGKHVFLNRYLGVFNRIELSRLYLRYLGGNRKQVFRLLSRDFEKYQTTISLAKELKKEINQWTKSKIIDIIHYPFEDGLMADQINYAAKKLVKNKNNLNCYLALYNADSAPGIKSIRSVANLIKRYKGKDVVFQQSAIFTGNFNELGYNWKSLILKSGGIFQTQWTLSQEIPRIKRQSQTVHKLRSAKTHFQCFFNAHLAHCVGHGLFIKLDLFKRLNYFPTSTMNEDLPFGYLLCARGIPIVPIPELELTDTPETFKYLINQKKVWFWSYLEYLKCRKIAFRYGLDSVAINSLTIQGILNGLWWGLVSLLAIFPLIVGLINGDVILATTSILLLILFYSCPAFLIMLSLKKLHIMMGYDTPRFKISEYFLIPLCNLFILFTDSTGPWLATYAKIRGLLTGKRPYKQKTER